MSKRTALQRKSDQIDCELFRLIAQVEDLYVEHKRHAVPGRLLAHALKGLRSARVGIRLLMSEQDRGSTV